MKNSIVTKAYIEVVFYMYIYPIFAAALEHFSRIIITNYMHPIIIRVTIITVVYSIINISYIFFAADRHELVPGTARSNVAIAWLLNSPLLLQMSAFDSAGAAVGSVAHIRRPPLPLALQAQLAGCEQKSDKAVGDTATTWHPCTKRREGTGGEAWGRRATSDLAVGGSSAAVPTGAQPQSDQSASFPASKRAFIFVTGCGLHEWYCTQQAHVPRHAAHAQ